MQSKSGKRSRLLVSCAALLFVCVSVVAIRHWHERAVNRAVDVIVDAGGEVTFDYQARGITLPIYASETAAHSGEYVESRNSLPIGVVDISGIRVTPKVMRSVSNLPTFRHLDLNNAEMGNESWEIMLDLENVNDLSIGGKHYKDEQLAKLDRLSNLTNLDVWSTHLSESACRAVGKLSHLETLGFFNISIAEGGSAYLSKLANLNYLTIDFSSDESEFTEFDLRFLSELSKLETLTLSCSADEALSTKMDLQFLAGLTNLRHLELVNLQTSNDSLIHLKQLPSLEHLKLMDISIDDSSLEHISELKGLRELFLIRTRITGNVPNRFERLINLSGLALIGPTFTDATLKHLYPMKNLQKLMIRESQVTDEGKESLKLALPSIQFIEE